MEFITLGDKGLLTNTVTSGHLVGRRHDLAHTAFCVSSVHSVYTEPLLHGTRVSEEAEPE